MAIEDRDQSAISAFLNIVLKRGWYIVGTLIAIMVPVIYYNITATPIYEASSTIIYEEPRMSVSGAYSGAEYKPREALLNQIQEITSRTVALNVVEALPERVIKHLAPKADEELEEDIDLRAYYAAKIRKNMDAKPVAESDVIAISYQNSDPRIAMTVANSISQVLQERNLRLRQEQAGGVKEFIAEQRNRYKQRLDESEQNLRQFKESNQVTSLDNQVEELIHRASSIEALYQTVKSEREKTEKRLDTISEKLSTSRENLAPSVSNISTPMIQQLKEELKDKRTQYIRQQLAGVPENNPKMVQLRGDLEQIRNSLSEEARKLVEQEDLIDPLSQMASLYEEKINLEIELETLITQERSLAQGISRYEEQLSRLPSKEYELARLTRERDLASSIYASLSQKHEEARIEEAERIGSLRIIDRADLPRSPTSPRKNLNLAIGIVLALTMGLGLAFFMESLDTSIKTPEEVERKIGLPVIGSIPRVHPKPDIPDETEYKKPSPALVAYYLPSSAISEAYRTLRTNLQFAPGDEHVRTFMVTSSGPREGKSTTCANLAVVTAQMGLRTLLIDADMRKPTGHQFMALHRSPGLADILSLYFLKNRKNGKYQNEKKETDMEEPSNRAHVAVQQMASLSVAVSEAIQKTSVSRLDFLSSGDYPENPSEILASDTMRDLLELVSEKYDFVVIDAPPIIAVTDAAVLAPHVNAIALVIESGRNDKEIILKAKGMLDRVSNRVVGAIVNNIHEKNLYGDYNYYYTYYTEKNQSSRRS